MSLEEKSEIIRQQRKPEDRLYIQWFLDGYTSEGMEDFEKAFADLHEYYAVKAKRHPKFPNLIHFSYNQLESPFADPLVRECRGIILDSADNWKVVSRGFDKFFNYGEALAAEIDWSTAVVQEKVDGSLIMLYYYGGQWNCATTGSPDAGGEVQGYGLSFAEYFWQTAKQYGDWLSALCVGTHTFMFELQGAMNRVVCEAPNPTLTYLGSRRLEGGLPPSIPYAPLGAFVCTGVPEVQQFPLQSIADVESSFKTMNPLQQEGYVIVDAAGNRIKVKHPGYVALHHLKFSCSMKSLVDIARKGETSEVEAHFPELKRQLEDARFRLSMLDCKLNAYYNDIKSIEEMKAFAAEVEKLEFSGVLKGALYAVKRKKTESFKSYVNEMQLDALMRELGYRD